MRTLDSILDSLDRSGYAHLKKTETSAEEAEVLCALNGFTKEDTSYHYVLRRNGNHGSKTDWDQISKDRAEKRLRAATAKKKKEQK